MKEVRETVMNMLFKYFWQNRQNWNRSIIVNFFRGTTFVEGSYFCFLPETFILWLQIKVTCSTICGAASSNNLGPMSSVPVLLISIFERYFKTLSFSILEITNLVSAGSFFRQNSLNFSWLVFSTGCENLHF